MADTSPPAGGMLDGSRVNTPRAMLLCALGALTGLGIAGYGLFNASGTATKHVAPENVATVNQRPILRSDFVNQLESETGKHFNETTRAEQLQVLDEMVREELMVQRALELDFAETDQGSRNALVSAITDQTVAEVTTSEPTEAQLRDFYAAHPGQWASEGQMTLRHFVLPYGGDKAQAERQAQQADEELHTGIAPEQVIMRHGLRELPRQDDEYYFAVKYRLGDAVFARVVALGDGEVSAPIEAADGVHLVAMIKNVKPVAYTFDAARPQVLSDYNTAMQTRIMNNTLKFLRERATVRIADDYAKEYKP